jgi:IS30 family transposase
MTQQQFDAAAEVKTLKQQMEMARQRRMTQSALTKHRGEIVALLKAGASFRLIEKWLKRNKHLSISHTTIMRFAKKLPELQSVSATTIETKIEDEETKIKTETQQ